MINSSAICFLVINKVVKRFNFIAKSSTIESNKLMKTFFSEANLNIKLKNHEKLQQRFSI